MICRHTKHRYLHVQTHAQYPAYCAKSRAQYAMYLAHTRRYATHNERVFQMRVCSCALTISQRTCMRACRAARTQPYTPLCSALRASQTQSAAHAQIALVDRVCTNERGAHPLENTRNSIAPSALATPAPRPTLHPQKAATYVKHAIAPDRACYSTSSPLALPNLPLRCTPPPVLQPLHPHEHLRLRTPPPLLRLNPRTCAQPSPTHTTPPSPSIHKAPLLVRLIFFPTPRYMLLGILGWGDEGQGEGIML